MALSWMLDLSARRSSQSPGRHAGFTMIEVLVVIGILSILAALLLPAIQTARSSVRAVQCQSNMRQLAFAIHGYHASHSMLPGYIQLGDTRARRGAPVHSYISIHAQLLPYLDLDRLYSQINLNIRVAYDLTGSPTERAPNTTVANTRVGVFQCPADVPPWAKSNSYRGNWGVGPHWARTAEFPDSANGFFSGHPPYPIRFATVLDGLQRTAMFAERFVGSGEPTTPSDRDVFVIPVGVGPLTGNEAAAVCTALSQLAGAAHYTAAGSEWFYTGLHQTLYTHALTPNAAVPDCLGFSSSPARGIVTTRSHHLDGAHVAFGDGSVRAVMSSIDLDVWRALGTRDDGEIVLDSQY